MITALASLAALTGSLVALPLLPSFHELFVRRDTRPMPIRDRTEHITDFAQDFRNLIKDPRAAAQHALPCSTALVLDEGTVLESGLFFADHIYARGKLAARGSNVFSAILGEMDVDLGENSTVLCWVHAQGTVFVGARTVVHGRVSAGEQVQLSQQCSFERVSAPVVTTMGSAEATAIDPVEWEGTRLLERVTPRLLVQQEFMLRVGEFLDKNVVAGGRICLAENSRVLGSLKSSRDMELEPHVRIEGSLVSGGDLRIGGGCLVQGPVLAEGELVIESGARIGAPKHPTSLRAPRIRIAPGVTIHGSVWADEFGEVCGSSTSGTRIHGDCWRWPRWTARSAPVRQ